ncbi:hypothetical protein, partial [Listeria monocytogenes]|uniref:hypothetical protein n=1 Tax=Listeria monocytogenes TaxID=1639 RepID=UPI001C0F3468
MTGRHRGGNKNLQRIGYLPTSGGYAACGHEWRLNRHFHLKSYRMKTAFEINQAMPILAKDN